MKFRSVQLSMNQDEVQSAINERLDAGYSLSHLHVMTDGICATLHTPWTNLDVTVKISQPTHFFVSESADYADLGVQIGESVVTLAVEVSKWIRLPRSLLAFALQRLTAQMAPGVRTVGTTILIDFDHIFRPEFSMTVATLVLADGYVTLIGEDVRLELSPE